MMTDPRKSYLLTNLTGVDGFLPIRRTLTDPRSPKCGIACVVTPTGLERVGLQSFEGDTPLKDGKLAIVDRWASNKSIANPIFPSRARKGMLHNLLLKEIFHE
jgi:hypothetical protein